MNETTQLDDRPAGETDRPAPTELRQLSHDENRIMDQAFMLDVDPYVCRPAKHSLTQSELQFLREEIRVLIKSYAELVTLGKKVCHYYHEAATPDTDDGIACFEKHSKYRADLLNNKKSLRKFENIQRKIRIQLGQSSN